MEKSKQKNFILKLTLFLFFIFFFLPSKVEGIFLFLETEESKGWLAKNEIFFKIKIDPKEEIINVVELEMTFDSESLEFLEFKKENSVLTFWLKEPKIKGNKISFSGAIPDGFRGIFIGTPLEANELILLKFKKKGNFTKEKLKEIVRLKEAKVFLNDGKGKEIKIENFIWQEKKDIFPQDFHFLSGILYNGIRWKIEKVI